MEGVLDASLLIGQYWFMDVVATFMAGSVELVVVTRRELERLGVGKLPPTERERATARLRAAREHAGLTQEELGARLQVSQPAVCAAERGHSRFGADYLARVLKACGLPEGWTPPKAKRTTRSPRSARAARARARRP
jgi:DNA-binding XRE family transcriptional regulator